MYIIAAVAAATNNKPTGALGNLTLASIFIWVVSGGSLHIQRPCDSS
jgi:hypothetical protein